MTLVSADPLDFSCPAHNTDTVSRAGEEVTGEVYSWDACSDLCRNRCDTQPTLPCRLN